MRFIRATNAEATDGDSNLVGFMNAFAAAYQLLTRAGGSGFLVEYVCLATSV